jgi:hypothetical protein
VSDSARTRLLDQARRSAPAQGLNKYVSDNSGDLEGYLWGRAMGETRQTAGRPVRKGMQETYSSLKHRVTNRGEEGEQSEKKSGLAPFFTKIAMSLVQGPKMELKNAPTPKTFSSAGAARNTLKFKGQVNKSSFKPPSADVVKPGRSIPQAMTAASPRAPR